MKRVAVALAVAALSIAPAWAQEKSLVKPGAKAEKLAGDFAFTLFALGIVGTGLLAIPVLAGSVGYAVSETMGWKTGLDNMPWQAGGFYTVIGLAMILGLAIGYSPINPIQALYWSAVINGLVAVPLMAAMMYVASHRMMGQFRVGPVLGTLGWLSTAVMAAAAAAMIYVSVN